MLGPWNASVLRIGEGNQSLFGEEVLSFTILSLVCDAVLEIHLDPGLVANAICGGKRESQSRLKTGLSGDVYSALESTILTSLSSALFSRRRLKSLLQILCEQNFLPFHLLS